MTTGLALGLAGAAIGFFTGGVGFIGVGFLAGSLIGNLIDPPKSEGPRLSDLKLQRSTYGAMVPFVWGTGRLAGNCIDQTDLQEHQQKSGGKGGPEITNYTYSASFDLLLCATPVFGQPAILGCTRIWADGRLIWSTTTGDPMPCTLYLGSDTQLPDPTFEAIHGVGSVPAYRGFAHAVFADYYLTDFGNRIPQMEFEVYTSVTGDVPTRVATWQPPKESNWVTGGQLNGGKLLIGIYDRFSPFAGQDTVDWTMYEYEIDGTLTNTFATVSCVPLYGATRFTVLGVQNSATLGVGLAFQQGGGSPHASGWYWQGIWNFSNILPPVLLGGESHYAIGHASPPFVTGDQPGDYLYATGGVGVDQGWIARYLIQSTYFPESLPDAYYEFPEGPLSGSYQVTVDENGVVYVIKPAFAGGREMLSFDADLNLVDTWTAGDFPSAYDGGWQFKVHGGQLLLGGGQEVRVWDMAHPMAQVGSTLPLVLQTPQNYPMVSLVGCLALSNDGIIDMCAQPGPVLLSTIVGNLSDMTPAVGAYDVSELTDEVRWFAVASNMTVRNAISTLRPVFFFDAVESDDIIKFRKRGGAAIASIPDDDLCARPYGEESPDPLRTVRTREQELPRTVTMSYIDVDTDYQIGAQSSPRQVTLSQSDVTFEVPVGLTAQEAAQKCWAVQSAEWIEREKFEWSLTRKWAKLEPCDVVIVRGREIRIVTRDETPGGIIKFTGVLSAPSIYTQTAPGSNGGFVPQVPPGARVATNLLLFNMPMATDTEFPRGFYAAAAASTTGAWTGYGLYKSVDAGANYFEVGSSLTPTTMGTTSDVLPNFDGIHFFDELSTVTVMVGPGGGTLASVTEALALAGDNLFMIGNEWVIAKNCVAIATDTYQLSGLLRGLRGTESAMIGHVAGEPWALASTMLNVDCPESQLFQSHLFKAVTFGTAISSATPITFTDMAIGALCYAPVYLRGGPNGAGDIVIECTRRTRTGGAWLSYVDAALGEVTEEYVAQIWDASYTTCARAISGLTTPTTTYSAADQVTDFGATQAGVYVSFAQIGAYGEGQQVRGLIPGAGASITAPIVSVTPYGGNPSAPPSGGGGTVNSAMVWPSQQDTTTGYKIGDTWVASFTTPAAGTISGHIDASEFAEPAYYRHIKLCTDAAGVNVLTNGEAYGNQAGLIFGSSAVNVAHATTYYFVVKTETAPGVPSGPVGAPAQMHITLIGAPP